jgi:glutamine amidotransferase
MSVAILKYNAGNVQSVQFAMKRLGAEATVTNDHAALRAASHVIIPGVGEAGSAMAYFREHGLDTLLPTLTQPVLGICLGLQVMCSHSEEADTPCLGIFSNPIRLFKGPEKVPQIGWNTVEHTSSGLFERIENPCFMYFVHSYYAEPGPDQVATTEYINPFAAALSRDNFHAVQFHPEKSADAGQQLLQNFLSMTP